MKDTSIPISQESSETLDLESFFSKTLKGSFQQNVPTEHPYYSMSLEIWKKEVIAQRGEYSARLKLAHPTNEKEYLSWLTPRSNEPTGNPESFVKRNGDRGKHCHGSLSSQVNWPTARTSDAEGGRIQTELTDQGFRSRRKKSDQWFGAKLRDAVETHEKKNWPTASARDWKDTPGMSKERSDKKGLGRIDQLPRAVYHYGLQDQEKNKMNGKNQESWATPLEDDANNVNPSEKRRKTLAKQVQVWPTPRSAMTGAATKNRLKDKERNLEKVAYQSKDIEKLNPNWVEQLMGLPTGWTDFACWEMESYLKRQKELTECYMKG